MRKSSFFVTAIIVTTMFVLSLIGLSFFEEGRDERDHLRTAAPALQTESSVAETTVPSPTPTPTPTPVPVYVPGAEELLPVPELTALNYTSDGLSALATEEGYEIKWDAVLNADYYILCYSTDGTTYTATQILSSDIIQWKYMDVGVTGFMLLAYQDHALEGMEEDTLLRSYLFEMIKPTPTPTPKPKGPKATATPTPVPTAKPLNTYKIIVDKADSAFGVFTYDASGQYTVLVATYPAALGGSKTPTGTFSIGAKIEWRYWSYGGDYSPFSSTYKSGRYFHGPIYSSKDRSSLIARSYEEIGDNTASGGCVRTTVRGAMFVYYNCGQGTVVEIVKSSDLVSYPGKPAIDPAFPTWDPTDPDKPTPTPSPTPTPEPTPEPTTETTAAPTDTTPSETTPSDTTPSETTPSDTTLAATTTTTPTTTATETKESSEESAAATPTLTVTVNLITYRRIHK